MKTRVCFATDVVESDDFLSLSLESQNAYFHLSASSKPNGEIVGVHRTLKSYGFGEDELQELLGGGYLLECNGKIFVRDCWINNSFEQRLFDIAMSRCEEYQSGRLVFEGAIGKSRYALAEDWQRFA